MAHFSRDPALCELLRNPTQDPFTLLAAEWRRVPVEKVRSQLPSLCAGLSSHGTRVGFCLGHTVHGRFT